MQDTTKTILFENQAQTVLIERYQTADFAYLMLHLIGRISVADHREGFENFLEFGKQDLSIKGAILNYLKLEYDAPESRAWLVSRYAPRYRTEMQGRYTYVAVVEPQNMFQNIAAKVIVQTIKMMKMSLSMEFFEEVENAQKWLDANLAAKS
ncbi:hypothetical protein [Hugenholtzia roseola]|uniref:hypothetical protein n=1 Tax=Hugenholtzia roseola TaxID=1002 RepID=UPI00040288C9|nr:hypothetical protein [Hugenholtzia roseola]